MKAVRALTRLLAPVPGEAFTSYIDRLAALHKVDLLVMLQCLGMIEDERYERMTGYGIMLDENRMEKFSVATRLSNSVVAKMLFASYDGIAVNLAGVVHDAPDTLRRCAIAEWAYFSGSHACPHCIREDQGAWQLAWKLPWSFACVKHRCYLVPRCPACERRLASGRRDRSLSPLFVRQVPKLGHCSNPRPDGMGRLGRTSLPCGHDLASIPTRAVSLATLRAQELLNAYLSGRAPTILGNQVSALDYFYDLRSLCAFILYCAEPDDLGRLTKPEVVAFRAFADERDRISIARQESPTPRNCERMRLVFARQESPELMAAIVPLATTILAAADAPSILALLLPLTERLIMRTRQRWASSKYFGFSDRLAPVIEENLSLHSNFDRAIGRKAVSSRAVPLAFEPRHVPQLLWQDDFSRSFERFFPGVREFSARRFCAVSLVKLCGDYTWGQSAAQLGLPVGASIGMANRCIGILKETGDKEAFGKALRKVAMRLSKNADKVDYCARRVALLTLTHIPTAPWTDICRAADIAPGRIGRRSKYAAIWLWAELTGGDWRLAPGMEGENIESMREVFRALSKTIMPRLAPHLRIYGTFKLEKTAQQMKRVRPLK
jgi:hypothetical protein